MKVTMKAGLTPQFFHSSYSTTRHSRSHDNFRLYRLLLSLLVPGCLLSILLVLGWFRFVVPMMQTQQNTEVHPTVLPWLQTQAACEHTSREWRDGECWDREHSPDF
jgi:hypothetical protein